MQELNDCETFWTAMFSAGHNALSCGMDGILRRKSRWANRLLQGNAYPLFKSKHLNVGDPTRVIWTTFPIEVHEG